MARQERHQKASDVFAATDWFLGPPVAFAKAFPRIATLRVRTKASGYYAPPSIGHMRDDGWRTFTESTSGEYIDCRNPVCYNGGFRLGEQLRFMEQAGETHKEWTVGCQGYEGSPKGRKQYRPCDEYWQVVVDVSYTDANPPS
jgi:hypothetical protein